MLNSAEVAPDSGKYSVVACPSRFQFTLRQPAGPVVWTAYGVRNELEGCWSPSSVSILTAGSKPWALGKAALPSVGRSSAVFRLSRLLCSGDLPAFHRLLLPGLLLFLLFISLTLGSSSKKSSLLHLLSLRN